MRQVKSTGLNGVLRRGRPLFSSWGAVAALISLLLVACGSGYGENVEGAPPARRAGRQGDHAADFGNRWICRPDRCGQQHLATKPRSRATCWRKRSTRARMWNRVPNCRDSTRRFMRPVWPPPRARSRAKSRGLENERGVKRYRTLIKSQSNSQQQLDKAEVRIATGICQSQTATQLMGRRSICPTPSSESASMAASGAPAPAWATWLRRRAGDWPDW